MKKMHNNGGFNIVELMIVVGIIGVLSAVVGPKLQVFYWKSFRAGAYTQLKALNTFIQVYGQDAPVPIPDTKDIGAEFSGGWARIVTYDMSTDTSCNTANVFGYKVSNCTKVNFEIDYFGSGGEYKLGAWPTLNVCNPPGVTAAGAYQYGDNIIYCPSDGSLRFLRNVTINKCLYSASISSVMTGCPGK